MTDETPQVEQRESIKLLKMSKGYQWEIRLLNQRSDNPELSGIDFHMLDAVDVVRLEKLNEEMIKRFGSEPI